nr:PIN domain-containing protein [Candidatus Njordarchaeota archaeon]
MRLLLDTTYFLPAIGISVEDLSRDAVIELISGGHQVSISDVTVFELSAKGGRQVVAGSLDAERVVKGIRAIVHDERVKRVPMHDVSVLLTAFRLRRMLNDFVDCIILSSAISLCDALITEDNDIRNLARTREFQELILTINPEFRVQSLVNVLH